MNREGGEKRKQEKAVEERKRRRDERERERKKGDHVRMSSCRVSYYTIWYRKRDKDAVRQRER